MSNSSSAAAASGDNNSIENTNGEDFNNDATSLPNLSLSDSESSSSEDTPYSSSKGDWKFNSTNFSLKQTQLATEISNSRKSAELTQAHFDPEHPTQFASPWEDSRPKFGINPLHNFFYRECDEERAGATKIFNENLSRPKK